jgi:hypothetical protein
VDEGDASSDRHGKRARDQGKPNYSIQAHQSAGRKPSESPKNSKGEYYANCSLCGKDHWRIQCPQYTKRKRDDDTPPRKGGTRDVQQSNFQKGYGTYTSKNIAAIRADLNSDGGLSKEKTESLLAALDTALKRSTSGKHPFRDRQLDTKK